MMKYSFFASLVATCAHCTSSDMLSALSRSNPGTLEQSQTTCLKFQCGVDNRLEGTDLCYKADTL